MLIKSPHNSSIIKSSEITSESVYLERRKLIKSMGFLGAGALITTAVSGKAKASFFGGNDAEESIFKTQALNFSADKDNLSLIKTPEQKVISHNNFYEFGAQKHQPAELSQNFNVDPWQLKVWGECEKPITLDLDDLTSMFTLEERIYRLRCVETWSMVIPWIGFSLSSLIKKVSPTSSAKYVLFETLHDPKQMPGQADKRLGGGISFPYVEGLRIDEAMNPLTLMSVGLYGKTLPPQNGAPIRLVVPWKYGFKSIKSIVSIKLVSEQPKTTWQQLAPNEYGFYANVNPAHDHPRWSQASERRITSGGLFARNRIETLPFNGYGDEVAHLYKGMDLRKFY